MSLSKDLADDIAWLQEHRDYMDRQVLQGYDAILDGLTVRAKEAKELETLVHSAYEFFNGDWEPDDVDQHKFLGRLRRADR